MNNKKYYEKHRLQILQRKKDNYKKNKEKKKKYYEDNKEYILQTCQKYKKVNKEQIKKERKEYYQKNKEQIKIYHKNYYIKNKEICIDRNNKYKNKKYKKDITYKISRCISSSLYRYLQENNLSKNKKHWEIIVGYTIQDLRDHLEKLFKPGMTWDNHGKWHIDHIIPKSFFKFKSTEIGRASCRERV